MKSGYSSVLHILKQNVFIFLALFPLSEAVFAQKSTSFDIHQLFKNGQITIQNREAEIFQEDKYQGIKLSKKEGEGLAWINDFDFSSGIIEFDLRGENVKQHSFVGIAFHGQDNETFDAI